MYNNDLFHQFYQGYLSFLEGRKSHGSELIFKVKNYLQDGQETGNPRKVYKIEKETLYIEEMSNRNTFSQCIEEELFVIYKYFNGDVERLKYAQPRKEKLLDVFHNFIEFKRPILIDMLESYQHIFNRIY